MARFLLLRLMLLVPTFLGVTLLTFTLVHMVPGDPVEIMAGERGLSPERHAELLAALGLDQPLWKQYFYYLGNIVQGDLGRSFASKERVWAEFLTLFPSTLELAVTAMVLAMVIGIPLGMLAAVKRGSILDHGVMAFSLAGYSMPIYWWALLLILFFSLDLGWTPVSGRIDFVYWIQPVTGFLIIDAWLSGEEGAVWSALEHLILPAIALATIPLAMIARMTRSAMLEVLSDDYIRTARAKGLSPFRVIFVHALRNALIPIITVIGLQVGSLVGGAVLTETIFDWPGVGRWMIQAVNGRDYPVVQSGVLLIACLVMIVMAIADILYGWANPKIHHRKGNK